jgi:hypothetical protein
MKDVQLLILKYSNISKRKTCFENLVPRSFRWFIEIGQN